MSSNLVMQQVRFSYSVLHELLISLHVLEDYRAYPLHLNWSLRTLRNLPPDLKAEREYFHVLLSTLDILSIGCAYHGIGNLCRGVADLC